MVSVGTKGEVDLAVAVNVISVNADVVGLGAAVDDRAFLPWWVLEPDHARLIDDDDVFLAVAVDVHEEDRVTDAKSGLHPLYAERGESDRPITRSIGPRHRDQGTKSRENGRSGDFSHVQASNAR